MMFLAALMLKVAGIFGKTPESFGFGINDVFRVFDPAEYRSLSSANLVPVLFHGVGTPLFLWVYLATAIKRLHDRDRSSWWMVAFFVVPGLFSQFEDRLDGSIAAVLLGSIAFVFCV